MSIAWGIFWGLAAFVFILSLTIHVQRSTAGKCPKCKTGNVYYSGSTLHKRTWLDIYECEECGEQYV